MNDISNIFTTVVLPAVTLIAGWVGNSLNRKRNKHKEENEALMQNQAMRKAFQEEINDIYKLLHQYQKTDLENSNAYSLLEQKYADLNIKYNALLHQNKE